MSDPRWSSVGSVLGGKLAERPKPVIMQVAAAPTPTPAAREERKPVRLVTSPGDDDTLY
jgi:hypothetical protein